MARRQTWFLAGIIAAAAVVRFATLDHQSYDHDEAVTAWRVLQSDLGGTLSVVADSERSPPLYYLLAWLWSKLFGTGEVGLRSLSALIGTLTVPAAYLAARELSSARAGLIAAALVAFNPYLVWYSQQARSYALVVLFIAWGLYFFARCLSDPSRRNLRTLGDRFGARPGLALLRRLPDRRTGAVARRTELAATGADRRPRRRRGRCSGADPARTRAGGDRQEEPVHRRPAGAPRRRRAVRLSGEPGARRRRRKRGGSPLPGGRGPRGADPGRGRPGPASAAGNAAGARGRPDDCRRRGRRDRRPVRAGRGGLRLRPPAEPDRLAGPLPGGRGDRPRLSRRGTPGPGERRRRGHAVHRRPREPSTKAPRCSGRTGAAPRRPWDRPPGRGCSWCLATATSRSPTTGTRASSGSNAPAANEWMRSTCSANARRSHRPARGSG